MQVGRLRHRISLEKPGDATRNAYGEKVSSPAWEAYAQDIPAEVIQLAGREGEFARQLVATASHRVRLRYREDVVATHRVNFGGRLLVVNATRDPDGRRRELELTCSEVKS